MCVKIITANEEISYDAEQPLETQLKDTSQIVINYEPTDPAIGKLLKEIERCTNSGVSLDLNLKVMHQDYIEGARVKKQAQKFAMDASVNELIKLCALSYAQIDKKLEDIATCLLEKDESVR
jgi:hypothetical protein